MVLWCGPGVSSECVLRGTVLLITLIKYTQQDAEPQSPLSAAELLLGHSIVSGYVNGTAFHLAVLQICTSVVATCKIENSEMRYSVQEKVFIYNTDNVFLGLGSLTLDP
jgi:hypothetical protein